VLEPIFEADFLPVSYGFRPKRRAHDAVAEIQRFGTKGYLWVLDADIEARCDSISHTGPDGSGAGRGQWPPPRSAGEVLQFEVPFTIGVSLAIVLFWPLALLFLAWAIIAICCERSKSKYARRGEGEDSIALRP
jgi:hypothetical protein